MQYLNSMDSKNANKRTCEVNIGTSKCCIILNILVNLN